MREFASDNLSGICPEVFEKLIEANKKHDKGYSFDYYTKRARELMASEFTHQIESYIVANGSGGNILALKSLLRTHESVIATDKTHINVHEVGGLEAIAGNKIVAIPSNDAKLTVDMIKPYLTVKGDFNFSQPKVLSISQPTELGTVYTNDELKALCDFAHDNDMYVFIDGARISNALVYLNTTLKEMIEDTGVDVFLFGGTKNGAMAAEMIVFVNEKLAKDFIYIQKQGMQMMSKSRFFGAQMVGLLENKVYMKNSKVANEMAVYLAKKLKELGFNFTQKVETNALFLQMDPILYEKLQEHFYFYINNRFINEVRLVTTFDTTKDLIDEFIGVIKQLIV